MMEKTETTIQGTKDVNEGRVGLEGTRKWRRRRTIVGGGGGRWKMVVEEKGRES